MKEPLRVGFAACIRVGARVCNGSRVGRAQQLQCRLFIAVSVCIVTGQWSTMTWRCVILIEPEQC